MTYNNHTLGLAYGKTASWLLLSDCPSQRSQSAPAPVRAHPRRPPQSSTGGLLSPPAHQANPGTLQPLPLAPSGPWSRSADPSGSTLNGCGLVAILLHLLSCHSSFQTVKHCACAVHCAAKSRGPRGQSVRMRRRKTLSTSPPNTILFKRDSRSEDLEAVIGQFRRQVQKQV